MGNSMSFSSTSPLLPITNASNGASNAIAAADSRLYIFRLRNEALFLSLAIASAVAGLFSITGYAPWQVDKDGGIWYVVIMAGIVASFVVSIVLIALRLKKRGFCICGWNDGLEWEGLGTEPIVEIPTTVVQNIVKTPTTVVQNIVETPTTVVQNIVETQGTPAIVDGEVGNASKERN